LASQSGRIAALFFSARLFAMIGFAAARIAACSCGSVNFCA